MYAYTSTYDNSVLNETVFAESTDGKYYCLLSTDVKSTISLVLRKHRWYCAINLKLYHQKSIQRQFTIQRNQQYTDSILNKDEKTDPIKQYNEK